MTAVPLDRIEEFSEVEAKQALRLALAFAEAIVGGTVRHPSDVDAVDRATRILLGEIAKQRLGEKATNYLTERMREMATLASRKGRKIARGAELGEYKPAIRGEKIEREGEIGIRPVLHHTGKPGGGPIGLKSPKDRLK